MGSHQQATCDSQGNDPHDDEEEGGDPLWGKPRGDAGPVSSMDCLTGPFLKPTDCLSPGLFLSLKRLNSELIQQPHGEIKAVGKTQECVLVI